MVYRPISDYGVIGNMHSAALIARNGSIDWLCMPRFDSPSIFGALLDDTAGGRFQISPTGDYQPSQRYLADSNVLETAFSTGSGTATLTDFMPVGEDIAESRHQLVRVARCEEGSVQMELCYDPRLDYARGRTQIQLNSHVAIARKDDECVSLTSQVPLQNGGDGATAGFRLAEGESAAFILSWGDESPAVVADFDVYGGLGSTQAFWKFVANDWMYKGYGEEVIRRSMMALHMLLYVPTGAVCAAVTTSLPERIGGARNWDYRFSWIRDAAFTMDVFHRLGHTAYTRPFIQWIAGMVSDDAHDVHSLYKINLRRNAHGMIEHTLDHMEGYRGSRPVRVGNEAYHQFQLDVFGEMMLAFDSYQRAGGVIDDELWSLAEFMVEQSIRRWQEPDLGIWEFRTEPRHFTFSKLMAWVAVDRGLRLANALRRPVDFDRWRKMREVIRADILERAWDPQRGSFVQFYGGKSLDASLLFLPMVGFLSGDDPRINSTIDVIARELSVDGLIRRYLPDEARDGLSGDEGTFTMCSLWLSGALIAAGRIEEAKEVFERVVGFGNHVGLYSEMLDPRTGEYLGNYPQAFTHIALIHTARNLDRGLRRLETGSVVAA